ncbi:M23 family metallopeptidase [Hydrocarboniclastica marina]|uniref:M23 family peptidase n=1 Tax=Hydrocarboniclastica marina TaxID=2259620 RepID=A0A4P7XJA5_9ALTE|nr:M23 family metallopeptidase [Hydrocarboniclastica marina]QCF27199.1 M23 family peptidase [Hydrocarboniclastica marina]
MIALVIAVQIALPLVLLLWLALFPAANRLGLFLQAAGIGATVLALALVSQWALTAWWLPWLYGTLWLSSTLTLPARRQWSSMPTTPQSVVRWLPVFVSLFLLGAGGWYGTKAVSGRFMPNTATVDIVNPFGPGTYMVGHGGSNTLVNGHLKTLDLNTERFRPWRGQSYAVDFFGVGPWGFRAAGFQPGDPADYAIFGARLHAPCTGEVIAAEGRMPDFRVPDQDMVNRLGNHVILRCDDADIVLAHMRQNRVTVSPGDTVTVGSLLGEVGNSGASTEPHLHIHAQRPPPEGAPPIAGEPLAVRIDGRFLVRNDRLSGRE